MTRRRRRSQTRTIAAIGLTALAVAAAVIVAHVIGWVAITAAVGAACWYIGHRQATPRPGTPAANARSLAQRNRHLNEKLDSTQAKLSAAMDRADRAEEAAWAARDAAEQLAAQAGQP
jgi:hypothetical protein